MNVTVEVKGLAELQAKLLELPGKVERRVVRKAVSDGAAVVRDEMKARAPVYTGEVSEGHPPPGTLRNAVFEKFDAENSHDGSTTFIVGVRHGKSQRHVGKKNRNLDAYYFWWVEFGTAKMAAHPFMRPAFDAKRESAAQTIIDDLGRGIEEQAGS